MISESIAQLISALYALIITLAALWSQRIKLGVNDDAIKCLASASVVGTVVFAYIVNTHVFYLVYAIIDTVCLLSLQRVYMSITSRFFAYVSFLLCAKIVANVAMYVIISRLYLTSLNFNIYSVFINAVDIGIIAGVTLLCCKSRAKYY